MKVCATMTELSFLARLTISIVTGNRHRRADGDEGHDDEHLGQREPGVGRPVGARRPLGRGEPGGGFAMPLP